MTRRILAFCLLCLLCACAHPRSSDPRVPRHPFTRWHKPFHFGVSWRLTPAGVELRGSGVERTPGRPRTVTWIWETWYSQINRWSAHYHVPAELIVAVIAVEARSVSGQPAWTRDPRSIRRERGFVSLERTPDRIAVGLMQTTVATARAALSLEAIPASLVDDRWLMEADNGIRAGTSVLSWQARGRLCNLATMFDPPVTFAAYNAGGLYRMGGLKNRWKMRQYPLHSGQHVDRAVRFFNDAVAVLRYHRLTPSLGYRQYLYQPPLWPEHAAAQRSPDALLEGWLDRLAAAPSPDPADLALSGLCLEE